MSYLDTIRAQLEAMWLGFISLLPNLVIALIILLITKGLAGLAVKVSDRMVDRADMRADLQQLVETLVRLGIWAVGLMVAAAIVIPGLTPASLLAGLGVGALAIGFAFQDIFENFLAGILINHGAGEDADR